MNQKIEIYDTTLREGSQAEGISFSVNDKLKIISILDDMQIDYIEAGWPGANPKDVELFEILKTLPLKHSTIAAFGCTRKPNTLPQEDKILNGLLEADTKVITIFGKTWDFHVEHALNTTLEENLNMISDSIKYLKSKGKRVFFDAEHFFDGYKNNPEYAVKAIETAYKSGAERIIFCDTNGGCINTEIYKISHEMCKKFPDAKFGIHTHNDSDMAVANAIAAMSAGVFQIQGTFNGYGERCGNANLCSVIPTIQLKMGIDIIGDNIKKLTHTAKKISEIANKNLYEHTPYVGRSSFSHKAGIHASGVRKFSSTYEHVPPEAIGNTRKILVSDQSGIATLREKIKNLKLGTIVRDEDLPKIIEEIKKRESDGMSFEDADASFEIMLTEVLGTRPKYFELMGFRVITDTFHDAMSDINSEASIKLKVGDEIFHTVSEGSGPVNALDYAVRKALLPLYPEIKNFRLKDFKVRIIDGKDGTAAKTRVHIESTNGYSVWDTVGVSVNIVEAAYISLTESITFGLLMQDVPSRHKQTASV